MSSPSTTSINAPCQATSVPNEVNTTSSAVAPINAPPSRATARRDTRTGVITTARPRMSIRFATLLPITLPKAMPNEPLSAACKVTTSSGIEVPKATTVAPISSGETCSR